VLGAATRQHDLQSAHNLHLTDGHADDPRADQILSDRKAGDLEKLQSRLAVDEAALADARRLVADCRQ